MVFFSYITEILIEYFDVALDHFEREKFVVVGVDEHGEEEIGIALIHDLVLLKFNEITRRYATREHGAYNVLGEFFLLLVVACLIPLLQAHFCLTIEQQEKRNLFKNK